jgi:riboflavin kinase/FMN adenylyltransferase
LREAARENGFEVTVIDPVEASLCDQSLVRINSSMIRWLLVRGRVQDATRLLGRPYEVIGEVVAGDRRGRELGVPTVNLEHGDCVLPADGVYAGYAILPDGRRFAAAVSIGVKPTFGSSARVCEAHLIGYDGSLDQYGWSARLQFLAWLRDQLTYSSIDLLVEQMQRDIQRVVEIASISSESDNRVSATLSRIPA